MKQGILQMPEMPIDSRRVLMADRTDFTRKMRCTYEDGKRNGSGKCKLLYILTQTTKYSLI